MKRCRCTNLLIIAASVLILLVSSVQAGQTEHLIGTKGLIAEYTHPFNSEPDLFFRLKSPLTFSQVNLGIGTLVAKDLPSGKSKFYPMILTATIKPVSSQIKLMTLGQEYNWLQTSGPWKTFNKVTIEIDWQNASAILGGKNYVTRKLSTNSPWAIGPQIQYQYQEITNRFSWQIGPRFEWTLGRHKGYFFPNYNPTTQKTIGFEFQLTSR